MGASITPENLTVRYATPPTSTEPHYYRTICRNSRVRMPRDRSDAYDDCDELSHGGGYGEFEGFTVCAQPLVEGVEVWHPGFQGAEGRHVEDVAHTTSPSKASPGLSGLAGLPGVGRHTHE